MRSHRDAKAARTRSPRARRGAAPLPAAVPFTRESRAVDVEIGPVRLRRRSLRRHMMGARLRAPDRAIRYFDAERTIEPERCLGVAGDGGSAG